MPLGISIHSHNVPNERLSPCRVRCGGHHFFRLNSFRPLITSSCSATMRLSLSFSDSSSLSRREISRRLDISRNTVRRYIGSGAIEPSYPSRRSPSALDEFAPRLSAWLSAEAVKSRKQRRTLKQMFLDLKELGYEGSYDRVPAFGRQWKVGQMERVSSASKSTHSPSSLDFFVLNLSIW